MSGSRGDLLDAAERGDLETVRRLVETPAAGVDLECRGAGGETPLVGRMQVRAGVEQKPHDVDMRVPRGEHEANGNVDNVTVLLRHGADPNVTHEQETALTFAVVYEHPEVVERLLDGGAAVDWFGDNLWTALTYAVYGAQLEAAWPGGATDEKQRAAIHERLVELLLSAGATVDQRDERGWTPLTYAIYAGSPAIVRRLLDAGADPDQVDRDGEALRAHVGRSGHGELAALVWPSDDPRGS